ncbi:MAG: hypothetical protein Q8N98_03365 [bacterium]|nr:hypothetical protein [bacterium]
MKNFLRRERMKSIFVGTLLAVQSLYLKTILAPFYLARKAL